MFFPSGLIPPFLQIGKSQLSPSQFSEHLHFKGKEKRKSSVVSILPPLWQMGMCENKLAVGFPSEGVSVEFPGTGEVKAALKPLEISSVKCNSIPQRIE